MKRLAAATSILLAALAAQAADAPKTNPAPSAQAATIAYADLQHHIGEHLSVRSRFHATRSGTLLHWSPTEIRLRLDGGAELEMPSDTVRQASLTPAPAAKPSK